MANYLIANGPMPTTAAFVAVTTGTNIKTMLQIKPFNLCRILAWGVSFNGAAAAASIKAALIDTGTVFGTVTASADADVFKQDGSDQAVASVAGLTLGTTATGYTCTAEGTVTATKLFDIQHIQPTNQYVYEWPLDRAPVVLVGNCCRIRVHAPAAVDAFAWMRIAL